MAENMDSRFTEKRIQIANKYMERRSTSLVIRKIQTKSINKDATLHPQIGNVFKILTVRDNAYQYRLGHS